ncbi:TetR/AcrR family transcriptional regulator [Oceanobacillus piezotolerans]|uniref:TetR/AcrR family transcriptional regulator n=1 Tax=Oceanobacillus piezotolerans TaxID=2448030 RepID=A0A498DUD5_9BACI|nr:TetR/AcrR family transcriptional regulator [Oceanobacillus piezotolerans]RLL48467.1 TetR/AcrR family transcriptional regulator [Oceanobacillus piezotolerans]
MSSKKQGIILISREVIHSKGYQATSVSDIMEAAKIGKGQFYHYFQSKHDLGLAVVEDLVKDWEEQLIIGILNTSNDPVTKLQRMLQWAETSHAEMEIKYGCAMGNLAIEMSTQDEEFRIKINEFFNHWINSVADILTEMMENHQLDQSINPKKDAESIVAMIEGGILLMVSQQNIQVLRDIFEVIIQKYHLD